jgi:diadenosine tetraphosphate (Ap4A) HIT family hydrolase
MSSNIPYSSDHSLIQRQIEQCKTTKKQWFERESPKRQLFLQNTLLRESVYYSQLNREQLATMCVFCNDEKVNEGHVVSSNHFSCLYNIRPVFPGHVLILPKDHITRIEHIPIDQATDYLRFTQHIIKALKVVYNTDSINVIIQQGEHSGQSIQHLHVHFLPRAANDLPMIKKAVEGEHGHQIEENEEQEWMDYFRQQEHQTRMLSPEERQVEAEKIRKAYNQLK